MVILYRAMAEELEKCSSNNIQFLKNPKIKEEFEDDGRCIDDCKIFSNLEDVELPDSVWNDKIKEYKIDTNSTADSIKIELPPSDGCNIVVNDVIKMEEEISANDIKLEFDNKLFCNDCNEYYEDYCIKCGMLVHILNKTGLNNADNEAVKEIPSDILEIRDSSGQVGVFALKVIPESVKIGPFNGLSTSEYPWRLKGGKVIVSEDKPNLLNWMQHINPARSINQQNLIPILCEDRLYYQSNREIMAGEELLVYFGDEYDDGLNEDIEMDFIPPIGYDVKEVFACTFCCFGFCLREYLAKHKSTCPRESNGKFSVDELTRCPLCKINFYEKEYLECHKPYCYETCVRKCIPLASENQTVEVSSRKTPFPIYKCALCEYKTAYKNCLVTHVKTKHFNVFSYLCDICGYKANDKSKLERHMKSIHLKEYDYNCGTCGYRTNHKSNLESHIKTSHLKEFRYECEICDFKTNQNVRFELHMKSKHIKEFSYLCDICGYKTNRKSSLERHTKSRHLKEFDINCEMCDYKTNAKSELERHIKAKHREEFDYKCEICEYKTYDKSNLKRHVKTTHLKQYIYECETCNYKTNGKACLQNHIKTKHLKEFDYKCVSCVYRTNNKVDFEIHVKAKHLNEFSYKCESCKFKTNDKRASERHLKTKHLKEFDYNCERCGYKTNNKPLLKRHTKTKHRQI